MKQGRITYPTPWLYKPGRPAAEIGKLAKELVKALVAAAKPGAAAKA